MLKKIMVVCSLIMLLGTAAVAGPGKGKFAVSIPLVSVQGLVAMGVDGYNFGDDGFITILGSSQTKLGLEDEAYIALYSSPWSLGYFITDNLEVGLNIAFFKYMGDDDPLINLGVYGAYYLNAGKLMPFIKLGLTRIDVTDKAMGGTTMINGSVGVAYAMSKTVAPFLSVDFNTFVDEGTKMDLTLGLKFMF